MSISGIPKSTLKYLNIKINKIQKPLRTLKSENYIETNMLENYPNIFKECYLFVYLNLLYILTIGGPQYKLA